MPCHPPSGLWKPWYAGTVAWFTANAVRFTEAATDYLNLAQLVRGSDLLGDELKHALSRMSLPGGNSCSMRKVGSVGRSRKVLIPAKGGKGRRSSLMLGRLLDASATQR